MQYRPRLPSLPKKLPGYSETMYSAYMGYLKRSSMTEGRNSSRSLPRNSITGWGSRTTHPRRTTLRLMVKPRGSTRSWNNTSGCTSIITRMTGLIGSLWLNSRTTTELTQQLGHRRSMSLQGFTPIGEQQSPVRDQTSHRQTSSGEWKKVGKRPRPNLTEQKDS